MLEDDIATQQLSKIPATVESVPISVAPLAIPQDHTPIEHGLDELTQYKLHDVFDEVYKPNDENTKKKLGYIYEEVSKMVPEGDYVQVVSKIRSLMQTAGIAHSPQKISRLNEWLRLRSVANNAFTGMENLRRG